jgi:dihydrofolate reductase
MRKVTFGGANSLDNFIARPNGAYDWILWNNEAMEVMKNYWQTIDTIIMGRKTYDVAVKGSRSKKNPYPNIKCYVVSRTLKKVRDPDTTIVSGDPGNFVRKLKKQPGKDICVMGGGILANALFNAGVIDEVGFNIHPVLLGIGIPLFLPMKKQIDLELLSCKPFKNGCVYVQYRVKH